MLNYILHFNPNMIPKRSQCCFVLLHLWKALVIPWHSPEGWTESALRTVSIAISRPQNAKRLNYWCALFSSSWEIFAPPHRSQSVPEHVFTDSCPSQKMHSELNSSLRLIRPPFPTYMSHHLTEIQLHLPSVTLRSPASHTSCATGSKNQRFVQVWLLFTPLNHTDPEGPILHKTAQKGLEKRKPRSPRSARGQRSNCLRLSRAVLPRSRRKSSAPAYMMIRGSGTDSLMDLWGRTLAPFR